MGDIQLKPYIKPFSPSVMPASSIGGIHEQRVKIFNRLLNGLTEEVGNSTTVVDFYQWLSGMEPEDIELHWLSAHPFSMAAQLSAILGVTSRSVHNWGAGGHRINPAQRRKLMLIKTLIQIALEPDPEN